MNEKNGLLVALVAVGLAGCGGSGGALPNAFVEKPNSSEGLTNTSANLMALLENGELKGACERYWQEVADGDGTRRDKLLCGKEMFFYESFNTIGVPTALMDAMIELFPQFGNGGELLGLVPDPTTELPSSTPERPLYYPLGFGAGQPFAEGVGTLAFNCGSCHFGQLPDGRYAVGAPNHNMEYGEMLLALTGVPSTLLPGSDPLPQVAVDKIQPYLDQLDVGDTRTQLIGKIASLAGVANAAPDLTNELLEAWARWEPGTQDFIMAPLPLDDDVHTISKIMALWSIADSQDVDDYKMPHALLAHTGVAHSLEEFIAGFVLLFDGQTQEWTDERLSPLVEYVYSLRPPENPNPPAAADVATGEQLFADKGCTGCHDGARGSSRRVFTFEEIGSDPQMQLWLDPDQDGEPCCGLTAELTQGLRAPRLVGMWALGAFMHNGSVRSLEDLFCMNGPRPTITESPYGDSGHMFTCDDLSTDEKNALMAYVLAH